MKKRPRRNAVHGNISKYHRSDDMFSVAGQVDREVTRKDVADHAVPNFGAKGRRNNIYSRYHPDNMPAHMIGKLVQSKSRGKNASNQVQPSNQQGALAKDADIRPKK